MPAPNTKSVTLTDDEWRLVTAALLCMHDHDDNRGAVRAAMDVHDLREKVKTQLGWKNA